MAVSLLKHIAGVSGYRLGKHQHYRLPLLAIGQRGLSLVDIYEPSGETC